ncbi:protein STRICTOSIDINE SYNTHASE-LIKE 12 [Senna tora]|uniref:Protein STRICTOSIDINE SYNTHASE-LIKE 12 n=1 Tax=Senna tora TaxID=362788 RepID=A0A834SZG4_9FABA|nr:protein STRICTOSIDINE SYNTHASE-LIKE 12 [Senna tora]
MKKIAVLVITFMTFFLCSSSKSTSTRLIRRLFLPSPLTPESLAFDSIGGGPYTGVSDGRILKYIGPDDGFVEFASSSPNRDKIVCDGIADFSSLQETCGRPMGLAFNYQTGELYIADAYSGLMKVPYYGGCPTQLVSCVEGNQFRFLSGLDVDPSSAAVFFTQASSNFQIRDLQRLTGSRDRSGSLLKFDPNSNETTVLLKNLAVASGVAVSRDGSYVLVSEYLRNRIRRVWLKGQKQNTSETFLKVPGRPDNIKRTSNGDFWVAVSNPVSPPPPPRPPVLPLAVRVSEEGKVTQMVSLVEEFGTEAVSEVQEFNGTLYGSSIYVSYANVFVP